MVAISLSSWTMVSDNKPDKFIVEKAEKVGISDTGLYYVDID